MKTTIPALFALALAVPAYAQQLDAGTETAVRNFLGRCPEALTLTKIDTGIAPPAGFTFTRVKAEGGSYTCDGAYFVVRLRSGAAWVGNPWPLAQDKRPAADRIREFAWERLQQPFEVEVGSTMSQDGLYPVTLRQVTEFGPVTMKGFLDHSTRFLFTGEFRPIDAANRTARYEALGDLVTTAPAKGDASAKVTLLELSDFQCPACAHAHPEVTSLLEKYGDRVRYIRADLPLVSAHPWAFPAAVWGRAIWMQKPDAFWIYKDEVYENQESINAFTLDSFAMQLAGEQGLDLERLQKDFADPATAEAIRNSIASAYNAQVVGTPTFFVNGVMVAFGDHGATLEAAISEALK